MLWLCLTKKRVSVLCVYRRGRVPRERMTFCLKTICPSRLLVRRGNYVHALSTGQLHQILKYQAGKPYDGGWLKIGQSKSYFVGSNGFKSHRGWLCCLTISMVQ
jgi:hypothetical protein